MEADFSGWATKAGVRCADGRTIMPQAFKEQNRQRVPLVWQHGHKDVENVLGHAILEARDEGVYAYGFFNDSPKAQHAKKLLKHKDITMLSIWANQLVERSSRVLHGVIREVSLVLSGANPGALIENVSIRHSDGDEEIIDDEAVIFSGESIDLEHTSLDDEDDDQDDIQHADGDDETVQDVFNTLSEKQKNVVYYMLGQAVDAGGNGGDSSAEHGNIDDNQDGKEGNEMANVFEKGGERTEQRHVLSHDAVQSIVADATKRGSMKDAVEAYCIQHGINDIETLFPEAKALTSAPEFFKRRTEWVNVVLSGARKTPFSRVKTHWADLTYDEARAKGYVKGNLKKEEFFGVSKRVTTPTTVYKKQKLDRDDIIDITDFDVVQWMKGEMRLMLDEELARAALIGDGRDVSDEDKIPETFIRPIAKDHELFTITVNVNLDDANSNMNEVVDALTLNRQYYRGSGLPTMFTTESVVARFLIMRDTIGRKIYRNVAEIAEELRVDKIVTVEVLEDEPDIVAILVNMTDYTFGADRGGQVAMFDDFDIDYNQHKYLIETRCSGALTKLKSAIVVRKVDAASELATPEVPSFNVTTGVLTVPTVTGVVYKNADTDATLSAGAQTPIAAGASINVIAVPDTGYHFASSEDDTWRFTRLP